jgi:hypothetical protein
MRMLTLAMILDNPGEQPHQTRYRDPRELKRLGYSDLIVYPTTGLSGLMGPESVASAEARRWVADQYERVQQTVTDAHRAGLGTWLLYDAPSLAGELVQHSMLCVNQKRPMLCPASDALLETVTNCLESLLARIEPVTGVVLRLGDNDAGKLGMGYLQGNDLYAPHCARCSSLGRADRLERYIRAFYDRVVTKLGRKLIVRAWNVKPGGMHDNPELCKRVIERLPEDDRLILSFKFTHADFWRYQQWNPSSLVCGKRPIIYELQCQREFEGKGAVPDYQLPLWRDGMRECDNAVGLADVVSKANVAGLWAWVRGGGWRGPYITAETETWIDANVVAVPQLAANPKASVDDVAKHWIGDRLGCEDPAAAEAVFQSLKHSTQTVLETFYIGPYAKARKDPWFPAANFIQDDQIDAEAAWAIIQRLPENALDEVVAEKVSAEQRLAEDRQLIHKAAGKMPKQLLDTLMLSQQYAETLAQTLRGLLAGLVAYRRWLKKPDAALAQAVEKNLRLCQSNWVHHTQRMSSHGSVSAFDSSNLWDFTQQIIDEVLEQRMAS